MEGGFGFHQIEVPELFRSVDYHGDINLLYMANSTGKLSPFVSVGAGTFFDLNDQVGFSQNTYLPYVKYGGGLEYMLSGGTALTGKLFLNQMLNDQYDGIESGSFNDLIWGVNLGLRFYLGNNAK